MPKTTGFVRSFDTWQFEVVLRRNSRISTYNRCEAFCVHVVVLQGHEGSANVPMQEYAQMSEVRCATLDTCRPIWHLEKYVDSQ